jgi:S-adenosylmethionine:tRNA ribosyltransferase-isomerase
MKTNDFDYDLPDSLIAQFPPSNRDECKLMSLSRNNGQIRHMRFTQLPQILRAGDRLVFNNTKVVPARLWCTKETGGSVELLFIQKIDAKSCEVMVKPAKKIRLNTPLRLAHDLSIRLMITGDLSGARRAVSLVEDSPIGSIDELLERYGEMPLPHYIKRKPVLSDTSAYQTVFAARPGAIACPTAGLHFTDRLLETLNDQKVDFSFLTLHVGIGTFKPIQAEDPSDHVMHEETYELSEQAARDIKETRRNGGRIIAVGTTVVRVLEHCSREAGYPVASSGSTKLLILPGYSFKAIDGMITNFHVPKSTLLMLVAAFAGKESIFEAYREAIAHEYRFFSYGDAMIIV